MQCPRQHRNRAATRSARRPGSPPGRRGPPKSAPAGPPDFRWPCSSPRFHTPARGPGFTLSRLKSSIRSTTCWATARSGRVWAHSFSIRSWTAPAGRSAGSSTEMRRSSSAGGGTIGGSTTRSITRSTAIRPAGRTVFRTDAGCRATCRARGRSICPGTARSTSRPAVVRPSGRFPIDCARTSSRRAILAATWVHGQRWSWNTSLTRQAGGPTPVRSSGSCSPRARVGTRGRAHAERTRTGGCRDHPS